MKKEKIAIRETTKGYKRRFREETIFAFGVLVLWLLVYLFNR